MQLSFPLSDVALREVKRTRSVARPVYANSFWQISQHEFAMQVEGVGSFYACNGAEVEVAPATGADQPSVELYLNGSVYGAILHQRRILPLHGSSFVWQNQGIVVCGESGAGKSALTAAFCMEGEQFLTDDVTPIVFIRNKLHILALSDRMKLWHDTLSQLGKKEDKLTAVAPGEKKYYFPVKRGNRKTFPLHRIILIEVADTAMPEVIEVTGAASFEAMRNSVYRWEYLAAMPESEKSFMDQLLRICRKVPLIKVYRPAGIPITEMMPALKQINSQH